MQDTCNLGAKIIFVGVLKTLVSLGRRKQGYSYKNIHEIKRFYVYYQI